MSLSQEEKVIVRKALKAWEQDICDLLHEGEECNNRHYLPSGDDNDFQQLYLLLMK